MPSEQEINKIIHKARGFRWVEGYVFYLNPSYTSDWSAYGEALEWAQKQDWWVEFICFMIKDTGVDSAHEALRVLTRIVEAPNVSQDLLNPLRGSTALAEFIQSNPALSGKEEKSDNQG